MNADAATSGRFSRYRSVRKAQSREDHTPPFVPEPVPELPRQIELAKEQAHNNKAPSRYRRPIAHRSHGPPLPAPAPVTTSTRAPARYHQGRTTAHQVDTSPLVVAHEHTLPQPQETQDWPKDFQAPPSRPVQCRQHKDSPPAQTFAKSTTHHRSKTATAPPTQPITSRRASYDAAREEARLILEGEYDRLQWLKHQQQRLEKERTLKAEAKLASERAESAANGSTSGEGQGQTARQPRSRKATTGDGSNATSSPASTPKSLPRSQKVHPVREPRSQDGSVQRQQHHEVKTAQGQEQSTVSHSDAVVPSKRERRPTNPPSKDAPKPQFWEPKNGDRPPRTAVNGPQHSVDAPVSAVNAGERRVEVRFEKSKITLPVTISTTAKDLLNSASVIMSQPIDSRTSVLIETYYPLSLERPLRRYEHIRDVMNSWDSDTQNYLMILPQSECAAVGLDLKEAPADQPSHTMVHLHHSQRPGKWVKHWMTLKTDGQVTASPRENDGSAMNVFHMSDFDIYMPSRKELKKLRPPKKICFAIKSQQRSIMFESTENFVHFFSTNDKKVADQWYNAVQAWRSWYLVNVCGAGTIAKPPENALAAAALQNPMPKQRESASHSRDSVPYQLGTFKSLLDFNADAFQYGDDAQKAAEVRASNSPRHSKTPLNHTRNRSVADTKMTGLERHITVTPHNPPASCLNHIQENTQPEPIVPRSSTDAGFTGKGLLARAFSVKKAQAEEIATFLENTENAFTGKGLLSHKASTRKIIKENPNPGVVENTNHAFTGAGLISKEMSTKKFAATNEDLFPGVVQNTNDAFTGGGLLTVQRALTKKKSTVSARPGQPLVDLAASSDFSDGSLLKSVEGYEIATGANLPPIDRSRGTEVKIKTGEV